MIMHGNDIYKTKEWKKIRELSRAQLLLVVEGLKRGTIIDGDTQGFDEVIQQAGLTARLNSAPGSKRRVVRVATREDLDRYDELSTAPTNDINDFHKINAWFLGYPDCCLEEYIAPRTGEQAQAKEKREHGMTYTFGQEIIAIRVEGGEYHPSFNYRPPSFTPCSTKCDTAINLLHSWKEALETNDPKAAAALVGFNIMNAPKTRKEQAAMLKGWRKQ
jgi:hypothetical protein